jgi:hypothetical protein
MFLLGPFHLMFLLSSSFHIISKQQRRPKLEYDIGKVTEMRKFKCKEVIAKKEVEEEK